MRRRDKLCIGMSVAPTWLAAEGWRRSDSGIEGLYSAGFAGRIAEAAEAAHLDFVFRPDASALPLAPLEQSFGFASLDPTLLLASMVERTSKIGLVTTISTSFTHPYNTARQLMSLHWMSGGRAGWNVVTALAGHENFGLTEMPPSPERYARAAEYVAAVQSLWKSFPADALLIDRESGRFADTGLIRPAAHHGLHFDIEGPLNLPAFPGPGIPIMQAGASEGGVALAGQIADMVFGQTLDKATALAASARLAAAAERSGRPRNAVRLLPGLSLYLGETREEARALFLATQARVGREDRIARVKRATGLDLTDWEDDTPVRAEDLPAEHVPPLPGQRAILQALIASETPSVRDLLARPEVLASVHWQIIGTISDATEIIADWFESGAIDGFVAVPGGSWACFERVLGELVPRLAAAGLFREAYSGDTLAHHLDA
ncbi:NtaA/DmoA family FMN-dependent monooxygenase [Alloyangia pacifica]|uniref:NtaA/DmoA family FMN-dependent monooxygenase n=1 Tax=Alloyangia pacifica TaxID=311180 RepID=UPI001CD23F6E|nr:NtaA/DmoA family FMN-dependent monooxygenase [Alloyangia pacifica]MCA0994975.1 NtaA/DmoA family FMN-dependent monooxygenase [Alloyangia pacifica]